MTGNNIIPQNLTISKKDRNRLLKNNSFVIWFTGLSGSGKSTLANETEKLLNEKGYLTYLLDGDNIRGGLNKGLTFSEEDRKENIRRIGEVAKLMVDAGVIVLTAFISPFREDRDSVRRMLEKDEFVEVYLQCPIEKCEERDVKGLYKMARNGEIKDFTGIDSPYEEPLEPEVVIETGKNSLKESTDLLIKKIDSIITKV
ncbi:MAG TPA: adenylyl-sulfate kinase [Ignavibacteria bacterium]|nr:adenylyl-sulfate kinase [Ignavibacteria bacterium]